MTPSIIPRRIREREVYHKISFWKLQLITSQTRKKRKDTQEQGEQRTPKMMNQTSSHQDTKLKWQK